MGSDFGLDLRQKAYEAVLSSATELFILEEMNFTEQKINEGDSFMKQYDTPEASAGRQAFVDYILNKPGPLSFEELIPREILTENSQAQVENRPFETAGDETKVLSVEINPTTLREFIIKHFKLEDVRSLAEDCGIDYEELGQQSKEPLTRELIRESVRLKRLPDLVLLVKEQRSELFTERFGKVELKSSVPDISRQQDIKERLQHYWQRKKRLLLSASLLLGSIVLAILGFIANITGILGYFGINPPPLVQTQATVTFTLSFTPTPSYTPTSIPTITPSTTFSPTPTIQSDHVWELSYDSPSYLIRALAVYNGKLYAVGTDYGLSNGRLYEYDNHDGCDNRSWKDITGKFGATIDAVESLQFFNEKLYIGTSVDNRGEKEARVYYYDGKDITLDFSTNGTPGYSGIVDFVIHNNVLYTANESENGGVYRRNNEHGWDKIITGSVRSLASYNGSLYLGSWGPEVWHWTDDEWEPVKDFTDGQFNIKELDSVWSLETFDNKLYVGLGGSTADTVFIPAFDGKDWKSVGEEVDSSGYTRLVVLDNRLWVVADRGQVFTLEDSGRKELPTISKPKADGVQALALYNDFLFAGTFTEGRIYCIPYLK